MMIGVSGMDANYFRGAAWQQYQGTAAATRQNPPADAAERNTGSNPKVDAECKTCASRRYQDVSSDPGVSFQMAEHVSTAASVARVTSHEREHVGREARRANEEGQVAISHVRIYMAQCPECKKMYAAGGVTEVTKINKATEQYDIYA